MKEAVWERSPEEGLAEAEAIIREAKLGRLPVIEEAERVDGLPPLADLAQDSNGGSEDPLPMRQVGETSTGSFVPGAPRSRPPPPDQAPSWSFTPTTSIEGSPAKGGGGRLLGTAGHRHRLSPGTVALRWCSCCGRFLGVKLWPRTGRALVHTHGLCPACFERVTTEAVTSPVWFGAEQAGGADDEPPL